MKWYHHNDQPTSLSCNTINDYTPQKQNDSQKYFVKPEHSQIEEENMVSYDPQKYNITKWKSRMLILPFSLDII